MGTTKIPQQTTKAKEKTINYITKYMTKIDEDHPKFIGKVLCSKGIGAGYTKRPDAAKHKYKKGETIETYRTKRKKSSQTNIIIS